MGRFSSHDVYEGEHASEATRAAQPSRPSDDGPDFDDARTRSARESHHALAGDSDDVATQYGQPRQASRAADDDDAVTRYGQPATRPSLVDSDEVATRYGKPTPAAGRPSTPAAGLPSTRPAAHAMADSDELATCDGRDADDAATRFARPAAAPVFVAPAEIEGDRSPAMRARRSSHAAAAERASRPSYVAPSERPVPPPPRPSHAEIERRARASYVATSERADFASSAPDLSVDGHYNTSEIEELKAPKSVDYDALKSYLFDDISTSLHKPAGPVAANRTTNPNFPAPPHASSVAPPRKSQPSYPPPARRQASQHPVSAAPPARRQPSQHPVYAAPPAPMGVSLSSATPVAPIQPRPHMRSVYPVAQMPVPQDSYVDSSWAVGTPPPFSQPQLAPVQTGNAFKLSLSTIAAGLAAAAALMVMLAAILFIRSDDPTAAAPTFTMRAPIDAPLATPPAPVPVPVQPVVAVTAAAPATKTASFPVETFPTPTPTKTTQKKVVMPLEDEDDAAPPVHVTKPVKTVATADKAPATNPPAPAKKVTGKVGDKTVEQMLAELGEEQVKR